MPAASWSVSHHTRLVLLSLAAFVALSIVHTWPIAAAPSHWARVDNGDGALNIWAVNWVGAHLFTETSRVADANIFFPERRTLAFSEMMIVQGAVAAPAVALGAPPVMAFNIAVLAGFAFTGWAFCLVVRAWTGSWAAGYVAGSLAAFNAHSLVRIAHLQTLHLEFLALSLFALDRLIERRRLRDTGLLAAAFALHAMTSVYLLTFAVWTLALATLARVRDWWRTSCIWHLAGAAMLAVALLWPYLSVYRQVRDDQGFSRGVGDIVPATFRDYLSTGARVHAWWSPPDGGFGSSFTFPGVAALALVAMAMASPAARRDRRFVMCAVAAAGCAAISFAGSLPFYPWLHRWVPMFQAVRVQAHLGQFVLAMIAILAAFGISHLAQRWGQARWWPAAAIAAIVVVNAEALRAPVGYVWFEGVPDVYDALAAEPGAVVVELPFPIPQQWFLNGPYMVNSTRHWKPMLNGYSGFRPASYERSYEAARQFPSPDSLIALHQLGVTHMIVHTGALGPERTAELGRAQSLQQIASEGDILIFRFRQR